MPSLRAISKELGVSHSFLSQIRNGKRPLPDWIKEKMVSNPSAYHLLIKSSEFVLAGVRGSRTHLPRSSRGTTDLKLYVIRQTGLV